MRGICVALTLQFVGAAVADDTVRGIRPPASGPTCAFEASSETGHMHLAFFASPRYSVPVYLKLTFADGEERYLFADGLHETEGGPHIRQGRTSAWIDMSGRLRDGWLKFEALCLFEEGKQVSGWAPVFLVSTSAEPPEPAELDVERTVSQQQLLGDRDPARHLVEPVAPFQPWIEATAIMQPWSLERTRALVEDRQRWIPRLKEMGFGAVIFIPGPGDIKPNYPTEVLRAAIDDYHAAGMKVLMYWSIMHIGHHEAWHTAAKEHPEWWQRDAQGNPVTVYGDKWLCPNTGALDFTIELARKLAIELDVDGVMLDNNEFFKTDVGPTGYCEGCQASFREHIRAELGDQRLREMGLDPGTLRCPLPGDKLYPWWIDWRYRTWRRATATFRAQLREAKPGIVLCANTQYKGGWYLAVLEQPQAEDLLFAESKGLPGVRMSGKLAWGRALAEGKPVWNYLDTWPREDNTRMIEPEGIYDRVCTTLAWNASPWICGFGLVQRAPAAGWVIGYYEGAESAEGRRDEGGGRDGSAAAKLSSTEAARVSVSHQPFLAVHAGQRFSFRCWYRTEGVSEGRPRARLTFVDAKHKPPVGRPYVYYAEGEAGSHGWQEMRNDEVIAPEGAEVLNVEMFLWEGTGAVWFDDAELLCDGKNVLPNRDFETPADAVDASSREAVAQCLRFQRDHRDLYVGATPYVDVGLVVSRHSVDFAQEYSRYPQGSMSALALAHIPFEVVTEEQLEPARLARYQVVFAPLASCLSDEQLRALAKYAARGGNLLFTADTGTRDRFGVERKDDLLAELLGLPRGELKQTRTVGEGRARWLPADPGEAYLKSGLPGDVQALADAIYELGGGALVAADGCPPWVEIVAYAQPEKRRLIIHLDNQHPGEVAPDFVLGLALPERWEAKGSAKLYPLGGEETALEAAASARLVNAMRVPVPRYYSVIVVDSTGL